MERQEYVKNLINRLTRISGHLNAVKTMVEEGREEEQLLIQLSAIKAQVENTSKTVYKHYLKNAIQNSLDGKDVAELESAEKILDHIL